MSAVLRPDRSGRRIVLAAVLAMIAVLGCSVAQARAAAITDLGPTTQVGTPIAINSNDQVLSADVATQTGESPVVWSNGDITTLNALPLDPGATSGYAMAAGINDSGTVVGTDCEEVGSYQGPCQIVTWPNGSTTPQALSLTALDPSPNDDNPAADYGYSIDDQGDIGGRATFGGSNAQTDGVYAPGGTSPELLKSGSGADLGVYALSDSAGLAYGTTAQFADGGNQLFGVGMTNPQGTDVCDTPIGSSRVMASDGAFVGDLWQASTGCTTTPVLQLPGGQPSPLLLGGANPSAVGVAGVNAAHTVVGWIIGQTGYVATMWPVGDEPVDLNTLLPANSGWTLMTASAINDAGDIVGYGTLNGVNAAYLLKLSGINASITLSGPGNAPLTGAATAVGKQLVATVTVTALASNPGPVTALAADPSLSVSPSSALTLVSGPSPASIDGTTLQPGQSFIYTDTYTIAGTGNVGLSAAVTGTSDGVHVSANASATAALGAPLAVSVAWLQKNGAPIVLSEPGQAPRPDTIRLADTDDGEVPQTVTAQVTITNSIGIEQDNVSMNGIPPFSYANLADANQQVPASVTAGPIPAAFPTTLAPGASVVVTYTVSISDNGSFVFSPQVLSSDAQASGTNVSQGAGTITALPTALLYFHIDQSSIPTIPVTSGNVAELTGTVTNRSLTQSIDVDAIEPTIVGNGGGGIPTDDGAAPRADGYQPLAAGIIKPGATIDFHAAVQTAEDGGTRATLTYAPTGFLVNADGSETALTATQIRIGAGSGSLEFPIDDSAAAVDPTFSTLADGFTKAFTMNAASWVMSSFNGVKSLVTNFPTIAGHAVVATAGAAASTVHFLAGVEFNVLFWSSMDDNQKQAFRNEIADDIEPYVNGIQSLPDKVSTAITDYFTKLQTAYQTGNWQTLGEMAGTVAGSGLPEVAATLLTDATFSAIGRLGAKAATSTISLAQKLREAEIVKVGVKTLAGLKEGDNLLAKSGQALSDIYGIGKREVAQLQYWAKERGLLISVRSRNPESIKWIEKFKAVVKPELIKIKNVDSIDTKFLGYLGEDLGSVVFAQPLTEAEVDARIAAATSALDPADAAAIKTAVLKRYADRVEEWKKYDATYKKYAEAHRVNIGFDTQAQGIIGPNQAINRRFALDPASSKSLLGTRPGGTQYYRVMLGDGSGGLGTLRRVTGDIDVVAITRADGSILSAPERAQLYIDLQKGIGMQHGESLSWLLNGDFIFKTKLSLLADHLPTNELLAVFGPDGSCRAAAINAALTIFDTTTNTVVLHLNGAFAAIKPAYSRYVAVGLARIGAHLNPVNPIPNGE
jgi:hypothetical protein